MLKTRLTPVLLLQNGLLVRSEIFDIHQVIGNPIHEVERFNEWNVDELIYLDITREGEYDLRRDDAHIKNLKTPLDILEEVSKTCFMPLAWGGRLKSVADMHECFKRGADKVTLNTAAFETPELITQGAEKYGSQAIIVSIDARETAAGKYEVVTHGGQQGTGVSPVEWAKAAEAHGAGEILLQSIDRDGTGKGYDTRLITNICDVTSIPVIACSGVGDFDDYADCIKAGASAAAAANIWHFKEMADRQGKRAMARAKINVRL
jgi:imidazole glycerol-phosphate synthase subunit HisF